MATVTISRLGSNVRFSLPFNSNRFVQEITTRIREAQRIAQEAFMLEFHRQIQLRVVPEIKRRTPVRTGSLRRSVRYVSRRGQPSHLVGRFYGAFQRPTQRQIARQVFNQFKASIQAACANAARIAVQRMQ